MKVMLVTGSLPPMRCGVGDYTFELARALAAEPDIELGVLTSRGVESASPPGRIAFFSAVEDWSLRERTRVMTLLRRWQPDVVHIQYPTQGYGHNHLPTILPILCRLAGFRVVQTWHEVRQHVTAGALFWLLCQWPVSGAVVFVRPRSEEMMPRLLRAALRKKKRGFIPNASVLARTSLTPSERESIRDRFGRRGAALVVFFGFLYPAKGVELLFDVADPAVQHIVIVGESVRGAPDTYRRELLRRANSEPWAGKTTLTGFLPAEEVGRVIAAADAVILPFTTGGGEWNTSIHGAQTQGTFVITTSMDRHGYDERTNTYYARPGDPADMRVALSQYIGRKNANVEDLLRQTWQSIAAGHVAVYRELMSR